METLKKKQKTELIDTEDRLVVAIGRGGGGEWAKWVKGVKRYKLPLIRYISRGDVMYSMVTITS